jgi:hypothetical protein
MSTPTMPKNSRIDPSERRIAQIQAYQQAYLTVNGYLPTQREIATHFSIGGSIVMIYLTRLKAIEQPRS